MSGLSKKSIDVIFNKGVDTKSDDLISAQPTRLENMVFSRTGKGGTLTKRNGSAKIFNQVVPPTSADSIATLGEKLVVTSGGEPYVASEVSNSLMQQVFVGVPHAELDVQNIQHNYNSLTTPDHATGAGMSIYCWVGSAGEIRMLALDEATGDLNPIATSSLDSSTTFLGIRCLYLGGNVFHVYYRTSADTKIRLVIVTVTPASQFNPVTSAPVTVVTDASGGGVQNFDAAVLQNGNVCLVWGSSTAGHFGVQVVSPAGANVTSSSVATTDTNNIFSITCAQDASANVFVILSTTANTYFYVYDSALNAVLGSTSISGAAYVNIGACQYTAGRMFVVFNTTSGGVRYAALSSAGISVGLSVFVPSKSMAFGLPFLYGSTVFVPTLLDISSTTVQPTMCLLALAQSNAWAVSAARIAPGLAQLWNNDGHLKSVTMLGSNRYGILYKQRGRSLDDTQLNLSRAVVTLGGAGQTIQFENVLLSAGAQPKVFDGQSQADVGFQQFPEGVAAAAPAGGGGLSTGAYQACAVWAWYDNSGQLYRSAPSVPVSFTATAGQLCQITIPQLAVANALTSVSQVKAHCEIYRTLANGDTFFKEGDIPFDPLSSVTFNCGTLGDNNLAAGELLYTTGGVLEGIAMPACKSVTQWHRRLAIAGLENPYEWRYSTKIVTNEFVRFNEVLNGFVPDSKGAINAVSSIDDKLVLLCERGLWIVYGDGADASGLNASLSEAQPIPSDVGCDTWRSVVEIPQGILFHSPNGWHLLGHDLSVQYFGVNVEAYNGYTVRSAIVSPDQKQVRILCDQGSDTGNGICLVYDYLYGQWGVFPGVGGQGAAQWQSKFTRALSDGSVLQETPGAYADNGTPFSSLVETQWIKVAGIQGFQRIWRVLLLGAWDGATNFTVTVDVGYDMDDNYDPADQFTVQVNSTNFSTTGPFQIRHMLRRQKCEAIRFRIQDGSLQAPYNGLCLTGLTLECGVKRGAFKLPAGKTV